MTSKKIRVVLIAAACLGLASAMRLTTHGTTPMTATDNSSDGDQGASVLIVNSGYMVAIG